MRIQQLGAMGHTHPQTDIVTTRLNWPWGRFSKKWTGVLLYNPPPLKKMNFFKTNLRGDYIRCPLPFPLFPFSPLSPSWGHGKTRELFQFHVALAKLPVLSILSSSVLYSTVSILGLDEGYTVKCSPSPEGTPKREGLYLIVYPKSSPNTGSK